MRCLVLALVGLVVLSGCASAERIWYGCDQPGFRGWDYQKECQRVAGAAR